MRTSLWIVIVVLSGLVGFLMGYSVSSYTSSRSTHHGAGEGVKAVAPPSGASAGYGAASGGYGIEKPIDSKEALPPRGKGRPGGQGAHSGGYSAN